MSSFYTVQDVAAMSGLSVRTIRSCLASGKLSGEKVNGAWRFTPEQFGDFLSQDAVRRSAHARTSGMVLDFLGARRRKEPAACLVLDWPSSDNESAARRLETLLECVNDLSLTCFCRWEDGMLRAVVSGPPASLGELLTRMG